MATNEEKAAGGKPPAAAVSGPDWRVRHDRPVYQVELWPNQSLTRPGLRWFLGISAAFLILPLLLVSSVGVLLGLIPFPALAFFGIWYAIRRNARNLTLSETLWIWRDEVRVERREPNGRVLLRQHRRHVRVEREPWQQRERREGHEHDEFGVDRERCPSGRQERAGGGEEQADAGGRQPDLGGHGGETQPQPTAEGRPRGRRGAVGRSRRRRGPGRRRTQHIHRR